MPRIAIPIPTSVDVAYNQRSWPMYASAVERSGGEPVRLEPGANRAELLALARSCSGFCLPGSPADVDPTRYGQERDPATAPDDEARFGLDVLLLEHATTMGKPLLAICYGMQSLNVWRGGSLLQDLTPMPVNHAAGRQVAVAHSILAPKTALLASLLEPGEAPETDNLLRLPVNSSHHQAVAAPGHGLRIAARCPDDGVIEAIEADAGKFPAGEDRSGSDFLVGVQWHPERSYDVSESSRALFDRLVAEARRFAGTANSQTAAYRAKI